MIKTRGEITKYDIKPHENGKIGRITIDFIQPEIEQFKPFGIHVSDDAKRVVFKDIRLLEEVFVVQIKEIADKPETKQENIAFLNAEIVTKKTKMDEIPILKVSFLLALDSSWNGFLYRNMGIESNVTISPVQMTISEGLEVK